MMETIMWRAIRIAILFASCALTTSWLLFWFTPETWLVVALILTAYCDLIVERLKQINRP